MRAGLWTGFFLEEKRELNISNLLENIKRLKNSGYECGELDERNAYELFVACNQTEADNNARILADLNFLSQLHGPKPKADLSVQEFCEDRILRACSIMKIKTVVTHPFIATTVEDEPKKATAVLLAGYVGKAKKYGIRVALENQIYPVDMDYYLSAVPELFVNIDFAHAIASGYEITGFIDKYKDKIAGLHVSDSDGRHEDYHIMPGRGVVEWKEVVKHIERSAYDGDFHLEIVHERSMDASVNDKTSERSFGIVSEMLNGEFRRK